MWHPRQRFTTTFTAAALAIAGTAAHAGVQTQQIEYAWDVANGNETTTFDVAGFDDHGGTRVLDAVSFQLDALYSVGLLAENLEEFPIAASQWFVESGVFMQLWIDGDFAGIMTGVGLGVFSDDLAANDGVPQEGPDSVFWEYEGDVTGTFAVPAADVGGFVGDGLVESGFYPFLSLALNAPPPLYDLWVMTHQNFGTMTVTYTWHAVADLDEDGAVGFSDLTQILAAWGPCADCPQDLDGDGTVGFTDLTLLLSSWGPVE